MTRKEQLEEVKFELNKQWSKLYDMNPETDSVEGKLRADIIHAICRINNLMEY